MSHTREDETYHNAPRLAERSGLGTDHTEQPSMTTGNWAAVGMDHDEEPEATGPPITRNPDDWDEPAGIELDDESAAFLDGRSRTSTFRARVRHADEWTFSPTSTYENLLRLMEVTESVGKGTLTVEGDANEVMVHVMDGKLATGAEATTNSERALRGVCRDVRRLAQSLRSRPLLLATVPSGVSPHRFSTLEVLTSLLQPLDMDEDRERLEAVSEIAEEVWRFKRVGGVLAPIRYYGDGWPSFKRFEGVREMLDGVRERFEQRSDFEGVTFIREDAAWVFSEHRPYAFVIRAEPTRLGRVLAKVLG